VTSDLPLEPEKNAAGRALMALNIAAKPAFGFEMHIEKGIPLGSGLGGSAASAVGAVVAANALLDQPFDRLELLKFAMQGEAVASGSLHVDNIAPSLFGGLVLTVGIDNPRVKRIPVPAGICAIIAHPHMFPRPSRRAPSSSARWRWPISSGRPRISPVSSPAAIPTISI
jgi:homoserine kinase